MKHYLPLLLAFFTISELSAQHLLIDMLKDSSSYSHFSEASGLADWGRRTYYQYNSDQLLAQSLDISASAGGPATYYLESYTYTPLKQLATHITQNSADTSAPWQNVRLEQSEYDPQGRVTDLSAAIPDGANWNIYCQELHGFDDIAHRDSSLDQSWDETGQQWLNLRRSFSQYLPDGKLLKYQEDRWEDGAWSNVTIQENSYWPDGKLRRHWGQTAHLSIGFSFGQDSFIYDTQGRVDSIFYQSSFPVMAMSSKGIYRFFYDAAGNLIKKTSVQFNNSTQSWEPGILQTFEPGDGYYTDDNSLDELKIYDSNTQSFRYSWRISNSFTPTDPGHVTYQSNYEQWLSGGLIPYSVAFSWYRLASVGAKEPTVLNADCAFANPLAAGNYVVCNAPDAELPIQVSLIDALGRVVQQQQVMPGEPWAPSPQLSTGIYWINVFQNGVYLGAEKMLIARD